MAVSFFESCLCIISPWLLNNPSPCLGSAPSEALENKIGVLGFGQDKDLEKESIAGVRDY